MQNSRILLTVLCAALGGVFGDSALAASAKKKAAAKPAAASTAKPAAAVKTPVTKKVAGPPAPKATAKARVRPAARSRRRGSPRVRRVYVPRQAQPSKERYMEIQQALVQKGYFTGEPTGVWSNDSADALKRFQDDQSLQPSGKINSLSLIALGLGPKRNPMTTIPVVAPTPAAVPDDQAEPVELPPAPVAEQQ